MTINAVELASELATKELHENWEDSVDIYEEDANETRFTEEAQEIFNSLYDMYYEMIENTKICRNT